MDTPLVVGLAASGLVILVAVILVIRRRARRDSTRQLTSSGRASRFSRTASALGAALRGAWSGGLSPATWDGIEEALIAADMGVEASSSVVASIRAAHPGSPAEAKQLLHSELVMLLHGKERSLHFGEAPSVILVVGVNGTGKTTTIAKLGAQLLVDGRSVLFAAADTFRAAAGEQLATWGERVGIDVIGGQEGADPGSVVFDALSSAGARRVDVVIVDTAGRLHGKKNLMDELRKIYRVAASGGERVSEVLLVLDATAGQNGLNQVREFAEAVPVSGIVLTKLDGTARGGIVFAIEERLGVPVKYVGLGEGVSDLESFDPERFVEELLEDA